MRKKTTTTTRKRPEGMKDESGWGDGLTAFIGAVVARERERTGAGWGHAWEQRELAESAGLHPMSLSKIERGVQHDVGVVTLDSICAAISRQRRNWRDDLGHLGFSKSDIAAHDVVKQAQEAWADFWYANGSNVKKALTALASRRHGSALLSKKS